MPICNRNMLFCYGGTIHHMLEFRFSHHTMFSPSTHSTSHWSQLSFLRKTLKGLKNRRDVFIKRRLFLYAEIISPVTAEQRDAPNDLILRLNIAAAIARQKGQAWLPKILPYKNGHRKDWESLTICQVFVFVLEYLLQKAFIMWILSVKCHDITQVQEFTRASLVSCQFHFINCTAWIVFYISTSCQRGFL